MGKHTSYIPLHGHSAYSFGDSPARISDLVSRAKEIGADAMALTEHGNMCSFFKFYKECKEQNIKPIVGCELYHNDLFYEDNKRFLEVKRGTSLIDNLQKKIRVENDTDNEEYGSESDNNHFLAYAKNYEGVKNIIHLSNIGFTNFYRKPLVNTELIYEKLDDNNMITTGCMQSKFNQMILKGQGAELEKLLKSFKDKFGDNIYLEVQLNGMKEQNEINEFYYMVSKKLGIKPVFALDYHYANKEDWYIQYLIYVIRQRQTIASYPEDKWFYTVRDLYIKEIDAVYAAAKRDDFDLDFLEEAIDSTFEIRDKTDIKMPVYPDNFPKFTESKKDSYSIFLQKLKERFRDKVDSGLIPKEHESLYIERLSEEIKLIKSKDYVDYFLILDDLLNNFVYKEGGTVGAGRGSAPASLVLYTLGVTKVDPIKHNFVLERFINENRKDPADVDIDFDVDIHGGVEGYLKKTYGEDKVCHIVNFGKFGSKTAIKDLCRIFELDFNLSNKLTGMFSAIRTDDAIEQELENARTLAGNLKDTALVSFIDDNAEMFMDYGNKLIGVVRQSGKHASGILISNKKLIDSDLPVIRVDDEIITGVQEGGDEREVAELGYCKLDILGLITASIIKEAIGNVEKNYNIKNLENTLLTSEFDDPKVYDEFCKGNSRDIFQFGSDNMIFFIKNMQPRTIDDLCIINASWRPAAIHAGCIDELLENRKDLAKAKQKYDAIHPKLWGILEQSCGVISFQEQVMFVLKELGGFTLAEADGVRKILKMLDKKQSPENTEKFNKMLKKFTDGAIANGVSPENAKALLELLAKYSEYSFNRAHSFTYAINAYMSMWLKVNYPLEYYASLLNYASVDNMSWFTKEATSQGVKFNEFKMGNTGARFSVDYINKSVSYGLNIIKGFSAVDIPKIVELKADNVYDLIEKLTEEKIGKRACESLCRLNYFKDVYDNNKLLLACIEGCKKLKKGVTIEKKIDEIVTSAGDKDLKYTRTELFAFEKEYLQFYINEHPYHRHLNNFRKSDREMFDHLMNSDNAISPKAMMVENISEGEYVLYGLINDIKILKSKKTKKEYFKILLEDDESQVYITTFIPQDIANIKSGDFIFIEAIKNSYGFTKKRGRDTLFIVNDDA